MNKPLKITPAGLLAGQVSTDEARRPLSVFDMFRVGIGPSSSHTVGPIRAARAVARELNQLGVTSQDISEITVELFGSLGATGIGHGTDKAVVLGLSGHSPDDVTTETVEKVTEQVWQGAGIEIPGVGQVSFNPKTQIIFRPDRSLKYHVNGLTVTVSAAGTGSCATVRPELATALSSCAQPHNSYPQINSTENSSTNSTSQLSHDQVSETKPAILLKRTFYSIGGGFVMAEYATPENPNPQPLASSQTIALHSTPAPYPFYSGKELLEICAETGLNIAQVVLANEQAARPLTEVMAYLDFICDTMLECIHCGCTTEGVLPGGLKVARRAASLRQRISRRDGCTPDGQRWAGTMNDPFRAGDWVNLWALAVNEENAAGHRVVTAPTNGSAGVIPAVLGYLLRFCPESGLLAPGKFDPANQAMLCEEMNLPWLNRASQARQSAREFLLAAGAIGAIIKTNASIAGAEVGCQGEIGSASSMAAAGLAQALGGTPAQVENAAEIAMEHNLGLTCDPVGGLVQIPCIERNAMAAVKAINSARIALWGDGSHTVSLDMVVQTMKQTGQDMLAKYKETSEGGLAVSVVEC